MNISRSGVLFEGERSVDREAAIELVLTMPVEVAKEGRVVARGVVVRAAAQGAAGGRLRRRSPITVSFGTSAPTDERGTPSSIPEWHEIPPAASSSKC